MIVDIDEGRDAIAGTARFAACLLHAGASEVTNSLRPVVITACLHIALKFRDELIVESNGHPLHWTLSFQFVTCSASSNLAQSSLQQAWPYGRV